MPELPEVETIRRDLHGEVVGQEDQVGRGGQRALRAPPRRAPSTSAPGSRAAPSSRSAGWASTCCWRLDDGDTLVVHLGMSGQLLRVKIGQGAQAQAHPRGDHLHPGRAAALRRSPDLRRAVRLHAAAQDRRHADQPGLGHGRRGRAAIRKAIPELAHLGFDPLEDVMSWDRFGLLLHQHKAGVKALLMDQSFVAGIGNIYSDEILFAAGLRYDRLSNSLTAPEVRRLYRAMVETLAEAIKHRGSSLADEQYRDLFGEIGDYQGQHQVYDREGQPCRRCRNAIVRVKTGGRSTFFCEHCQV